MAEGVNVAPFSVEVNGVKWEATWDSDGNIHYAGVDSEGKSVAGDAPSSVKAAAKEHGLQGRGEATPPEKDPTKTDEQPKSEEVGKDKKRQPIYNRSPENQGMGADSAANDSNEGREKVSETKKVTKALFEKYGLDRINLTECCGVLPNNGGKILFTEEETQSLRKAMEKDGFSKTRQGKSFQQVSLKDELKAGWKSIKQDAQEAADSIKLRVQDVKKGFSLIAKGKFRELSGRVALRLNDNLEAMGILPRKVTDTLNRKLEENLDIKPGEREHKSYFSAKIVGRDVNNIRNQIVGLRGMKTKEVGSPRQQNTNHSNTTTPNVNSVYIRKNGGR